MIVSLCSASQVLGSSLNTAKGCSLKAVRSRRPLHGVSANPALPVSLPPAISCGAPPAPENGGVVGSVFTFGSKVTYR